jgi:predicted ester cyclase
MSADENKALVRHFIEEVFGRGHVGTADDVLTPDCVTHIFLPGAAPLRGTGGLKHFASATLAAFPDQDLIVEDQIAEGDRVVSRLTIRGTQTGPLALPNVPTMPPSGRRFEMTEIRIDRIVDGRIAESWFVYDRLGWFEQLGILSSLEAAELGR